MENVSNSPVSQNYFLKPGFIYVSTTPTMISAVTNEVAVVKVDKVRQEDWYPYEIKR
jgi:hypothetical protein